MIDDRDAVARLRHELRTPLNHVIGYSEMLAEEFGARRPELRPAFERLHALGHDVLRLVNDTLASSRAEAGDVDVAGLERSTGGLLDEVVRLAESSRRQAEAAGESRIADDLQRIATSATGLRAQLRAGTSISASAAVAGALCNAAKASQIFVTTKVAGGVEDCAETQPVDDVILRGLARPVPVFNVIGLKR